MLRRLITLLLITSAIAVSSPVCSSATTTRSTLVVPVTFTDDRSQPWTQASLQSSVFGAYPSARLFYSANSDGQLSLTGTVTPWVNLDISTSQCVMNGVAISDAAVRAGVDITGFDVVHFVTNNSACGLFSFGPGRSVTYGVLGLVHELGHDFGLGHAASLLCRSETVNWYVPISTQCSTVEYGDPYDPMGGNGETATNKTYLSAWRRHGLGFLSDVGEVTASGKYNLAPAEKPASSFGPRLLHVARPGQQYGDFWLEFRQPTNTWNEGLPGNSPVYKGVTIRLAADTAGATGLSYLVDTSTSGKTSPTTAPLPPKQGITDPFTGISIITDSVGSRGATVEVWFP